MTVEIAIKDLAQRNPRGRLWAMTSHRRALISVVAVAGLLGLADVSSAAQRQQRGVQQAGETFTRTIGVAATVTGTQNALTGVATLTDTLTGGALRPRRTSVSPVRVASQRKRMNSFIRGRIGVLQKLDSYRKLQGN